MAKVGSLKAKRTKIKKINTKTNAAVKRKQKKRRGF